jgi:DNA-binding MarR family transcriptional regulator
MPIVIRSPRASRNPSDYSRQQGGAAIGARLRRLSERIDRDANRLYSELGVVFEQRWMGVLNLLNLRGPMSVKDLAAALAISHPSVSQARASLRRADLIAERADPRDGRRRTLRLSAKGIVLVEKLQPIWSALAETAKTLNDEADDLVAGLTLLEHALDRGSLFDRVNARLKDGARRPQSGVDRHSPARGRAHATRSAAPKRDTPTSRATRGVARSHTVSSEDPL